MSEETAQSAALNIIKWISLAAYAILAFACIVLAFGFFLLLFGANPDAGFANFIYESAGRFMDPFRGLIEPGTLGNGGLVSWSALFAIAAYLVAAWIVSIIAAWARRSAVRARKPEPKQES